MSLAKTIALLTALAAAGAAVARSAAETASPAPATPGAECPPGVNGDPPTLGGGDSNRESLSEKLAESKGIICPPAGIDAEMQVTPPAGGTLRIIRPPGTPGGDPSVQPK